MHLYMKVADSSDIKKQFIYVRLFTNFVIRFLIPVLSSISISALPKYLKGRLRTEVSESMSDFEDRRKSVSKNLRYSEI
jgi:hypothetical protein